MSSGARGLEGRIGQPGQPCLIIGEVAQAHDGSLGTAHAFIDAIAGAGADAVKFQTHIAAAESTPAEPWRTKFSLQDPTRYAYWKRMEFTEDQWRGLKTHAEERGLLFLSSAFSVEAAEILLRVGVAAWKVASGEANNPQLLDRILESRLPVLLSTGMSPLAEIDAAVARIKAAKALPVVLQCTSLYPTPAEKVGLNMIPLFRERYRCPAGLSDHSGTTHAGFAAAAIGADVLEVHVTFNREMFGPDVSSSITTADLRHLVDGVRFIGRMRSNPVDKDQIADELAGMRAVFGKSIVARRDLTAGTILSAENVTVKKPGTGIPAAQLPAVIGRRLVRPLRADELLQECDLE